MKPFQGLAFCLYASLLVMPAASQSEIRIDAPKGRFGWLMHPYEAREVPPINLSNTPRLESMIRGGNLYLSARDAVALAIENNIDIEVQRYGPLLAKEIMRRAQGGGALRSAGLAVAPGPQSVSSQGSTGYSYSVGGGTSLAGGSTSSGGGGGASSGGGGASLGGGGGTSSSGGASSGGGGASLTGGGAFSSGGGESSSSGGGAVASSSGVFNQLGPAIPSFDPTFSVVASYSHSTTPQSNTFLVGTTTLIQQTRTYQGQYMQNWDFGLSAQLSYMSQYTKVNSQDYDINPFTSGSLDMQLTQNLLQGFGPAVNDRSIRVQKNNIKVADLQFKLQVITTVAAVLNLYWDLVSFHDDLAARKQELETAQLLLEDNKKQAGIGALPEIEVTRAEAQLYSAQADLLISQTNLLQQEVVLKSALSRNGVATPTLATVGIIPLDSIPPPDDEPLATTDELIQEAIGNRIEITEGRINLDSDKLNLVGVKNSLKPTLQAFAEVANNGLTGDITPLGIEQKVGGLLVGGYSNLLAQIARREFPNYAAGFSLSIPLRNRAAQSDYVTSLLEMRQSELTLQKNINQLRLEVDNAVIGLRQTHARYDATVKARVLAQKTLEGDQKKLAVRAGTSYQVVQDQRDLSSAASMVTEAMASYAHARITLDQVLGRTLDVNHISIEEAKTGHVSQPSTLPPNVPTGEKQ
jgi:outer membrane protein